MKHSIRKLLSLALALCCLLSLTAPAFAAEVADATIDENKPCSLSLYSFDWTNAVKDNVWDPDYKVTGKYDPVLNEKLGTARTGDLEGDNANSLENGETSYGYAIKGKEFTYVRVADVVAFTDYNIALTLYGFDKVAAADLLAVLDLTEEDAYIDSAASDKLDDDKVYFILDTLTMALKEALVADSTSTKTALENYAKANGTAMELTDEYGYTKAEGLSVGLYLVIETKVPEMVTSAASPILAPLPMTSVNDEDGGHYWMYDLTLYPKNETGIVTLEKTVREANADTGKNDGTSAITDGYTHSTTASAGDTVDYQIVSTLPNITSEATYLSTYSLVDTLSKGLTYTRGDLVMEWYTDMACTNKVTEWKESDGKFTVEYTTKDSGESVMRIDMTEAGLAEINADAATAGNILNGQYTDALGYTAQYAGYSNYTLRVAYTAVLNSDATFTYGEDSNINEVALIWKRTSEEFHDIIKDDCHVYSFGIDLLKKFSDQTNEEATEKGLYDHVKFKVYNLTDGYWVQADYNEDEGVFYVIDHVATEEEATAFNPRTAYPDGTAEHGTLVIKGLEDDTYVVTEIETADGYSLLKNAITVQIIADENDAKYCSVYADESKLGVYQNDGHYYYEGCPELPLANIPQAQLSHTYLSAKAIVDTNEVAMENDTDPTTGEDTESENALVPLEVLNTITTIETGSEETQILTMMGGLVAVAGIAFILFLFLPKKQKKEN